MLSNAYFLAKFRFDTADTAEDEPAKSLQKKKMKNLLTDFATSSTMPWRSPIFPTRTRTTMATPAIITRYPTRVGLITWEVPGQSAPSTSHNLQIFGRLVLGCINTKFCKKICVWQHFSSSTRFAYFRTAATSKFSQKIGLKNQQFLWNFSKILANVAKLTKWS